MASRTFGTLHSTATNSAAKDTSTQALSLDLEGTTSWNFALGTPAVFNRILTLRYLVASCPFAADVQFESRHIRAEPKMVANALRWFAPRLNGLSSR